MKQLDLFSGIGGFSLAAKWAGIETVGFVEIDPFCQQVLKKNFPDIPIFGDIKEFKYENIGKEKIDIITGGFPCQPFSWAGKRRGTADDRHLWPEMLRVIQEIRPTWVVGENVAGFVTMELNTMLSNLEQAGYRVQAFLIPACGVDARHRRARVWIVAHTDQDGCQREIRTESSQGAKRGQAVSVSKFGGRSERGSALQREQPFEKTIHSKNEAGKEINGGDGKGHFNNTIYSGQSNKKSNEKRPDRQDTTKPDLGGVVDGIPVWVDEFAPRVITKEKDRNQRIQSLGNAIVPQVAYQILKRIVEIDKLN